ncbi:hypothetical protein V1522DRAFT_230907 [Lipomyces starkeyi]
MNNAKVPLNLSSYSQKCTSCRTLVRRDTLQELQQMFVSHDGRPLKSCKTCRDNRALKSGGRATKRTSYDLDEHYDTHEEFIEALSSFLEQHDDHKFDFAAQSLRIRATLSANMFIESEVSVATCAQTGDRDLQTQVAMQLRNDVFDCTGYYFQSRRCIERNDDFKFSFTCSRSTERETERDPLTIQRYTIPKEFFDCHGQLHITLSKDNGSAVIVYDHRGHTETSKFHMTDEVRRYIEGQKLFSPRQIYQNLIRMTGGTHFEKTDLYTITRQQVYNVWFSITKKDWERDPTNDFLSAQLLIGEQDGYQLVEELREPGVSLAFVTPCFSDTVNYDRAKMSEIFVDSTFNTNRHGYELYCVLTEYNLVSLPLSYLLLDTRGIREEGKRGSRLTAWFAALRDAGLNPKVVHTDKDFAEVTAASLAFKRNNPAYKHHLCLWHSLRAIDQHITGKTKSNGAHSVENARNSIRKGALPEYLHFLSDESEWILSNESGKKLCTPEQAAKLRAMIKCHLLRHPLLPKVVNECAEHPRAHVYETYEEIHASSIREMLDYCRSIGQPKIFRYFWINWYRPEYAQVGSRWEIASMCGRRGSNTIIPISRTTMRVESHWRILKKDYASRFVKPRLDVLCYILFTDLVPSRIHLRSRVEAGREVPSAYKEFVQLWRRCANAINYATLLKRDEVYHADKEKWVCSCLSFIVNSRYICKHLVSFYSSPHPDGNGRFFVRPPPPFRPELFQDVLPLINFSDVELTGGDGVISSGVGVVPASAYRES